MTSSDSGDQTPEPGQGDPAQNPYGPPPAQNPYGETPAPNPYGAPQQPPYGQPAYGQPPHGQPPYGQPQQGGYGQPGYVYPAPGPANHPSATTALVLSLIGLAGIAFCGGITLVLSPFAWNIGATAVREIDANPGMYGGRDQANAGRIMGIIGTVLLGLGILAVVLFILLVVVSASTNASP